MLNEIETLLQANRADTNIDLPKVARKLCKADYEHYKANMKRAAKLYQISRYGDDLCIACIEYPNSPPRRFKSGEDECSCKERVTQEGQYPHNIKLRGGFCVADLDTRHM